MQRTPLSRSACRTGFPGVYEPSARMCSGTRSLRSVIFPHRGLAAAAGLASSRAPFTPRGGALQARYLPRCEMPELPGFDVQFKRPIADAPDLLHVVTDCLEHAPNLPVSPLDQRDLVPRILRLAHQLDARRRSHYLFPARFFALANTYAAAKTFQRLRAGNSADLHHVSFGNVRCCRHEAAREIAVVRKQEQAFARVIQTANRVNACSHVAKQVHDRRAMFRIADRRDVAFRLVQNDV